ncbi:Legumain [Tritrichomonas foetus]|uniref:Legumain n=1 Tax=Tritrichomonas foetus TaxID=1144522 RepID=A0A1J4JRW6_9EUKA|nr:Legumain [Tritrichomonas foetus]|eukprot:OHT01176.1 Legumain [Tritrichomonas foetus]
MLSLFLAFAACENWAVIFTGSSGEYNYRHTADSFYQYKLLIEGGIPKDHIILMNFNDWPWSSANPFPGEIYRNLEHDPNIFPGNSSIDYMERKVTEDNLFNVLKGNSSSGPVIKSTENDNVFLFYDDHGGDGILGVPDFCGGYIFAYELVELFTYMHDNKLYKNLFFPITACYAGSTAKYLNDIPGLYIQTASGEDESSYATLYDSQLDEYLTSEYSLHKDEFIESNPTGTLAELFEYAKKYTEKSHVMEYGDLSLRDMKVSDFVGNREPKPISKVSRTSEKVAEIYAKVTSLQKRSPNETPLKRAEKNVRLAAERACEARLNDIIGGLRKKFVPANCNIDFTKSCEKMNWPAYRKVLNAVHARVGVVGESFFRKSFFFSNLCSIADADAIVADIQHL